MSEEMAKAYDPKLVEKKWSTFWEKGEFFRASATSTKPAFCLCIPPPNVTGVLHMGHALVDTLQDVLARWKRMSGYETLWVPGTDHAGIATQTVVERHLIATQEKRRKEFSREEFLGHVWQWKEKSEQQILSQIKRLGCSCDFSRLAFTMDESRSHAVRTMFKKMFDDGLIYQGDYLVNWDPVTQTALADDEVEHEERASFLWYFRYPLEGSDQFVTVATTRPETLLGDTALAVAPGDERYAHLVGKHARHPLQERSIPIIASPLVDPTFGTGVVKVTPAHDPNDYEMAQTHSLPYINILTPCGKINENGGSFAGLNIEEARTAVVAALRDLHLLEKTEPYTHRVGISYRSRAVIEPFLSKQWFVRMSAFKKHLRTIVEEKQVRLIPENWENTYFHWIDNLRDWCISRQLWWGHRIPIWYHLEDPSRIICYAGDALPPEVEQDPTKWIQDEDVLDTWFSSALWPFSVLGWPENTPDLTKFYPNSTLVTGHDILFFWVARMILMGTYALDQSPFPEAFLHGLIYGKSYWRHDSNGHIAYIEATERLTYDLGKPVPKEIHQKWEKMSKSKGNVIDPIEIIDAYGADAIRMGLCSSATGMRQIDLDRRRFEEFKNFTNKIWNGARFVFLHLEDLPSEDLARGLGKLGLEDRWILSLLNQTTRDVDTALEQYAFDRATLTAYDFFWKEFCAYYVEMAKPFLFGKLGTEEQRKTKQKVLLIVLLQMVRLLHPMAPFVTEELFQAIKAKFSFSSGFDPYTKEAALALQAPSCAVAPYPKQVAPEDISPEVEQIFSRISAVVHAVRNIRAEMQLPPGMATELYIIGSDQDLYKQACSEHLFLLQALVRVEAVHFSAPEKQTGLSAHAMVENLKLVVPLPEALREKEKVRLVRERDKWIEKQNSLRQQLANPDFVEKAPAALVEKLKENLSQVEKSLQEVMKKL